LINLLNKLQRQDAIDARAINAILRKYSRATWYSRSRVALAFSRSGGVPRADKFDEHARGNNNATRRNVISPKTGYHYTPSPPFGVCSAGPSSGRTAEFQLLGQFYCEFDARESPAAKREMSCSFVNNVDQPGSFGRDSFGSLRYGGPCLVSR